MIAMRIDGPRHQDNARAEGLEQLLELHDSFRPGRGLTVNLLQPMQLRANERTGLLLFLDPQRPAGAVAIAFLPEAPLAMRRVDEMEFVFLRSLLSLIIALLILSSFCRQLKG